MNGSSTPDHTITIILNRQQSIDTYLLCHSELVEGSRLAIAKTSQLAISAGGKSKGRDSFALLFSLRSDPRCYAQNDMDQYLADCAVSYWQR